MTDQPARYRIRPAEVDAVQWTGTNAEALRAFCGQDFEEIAPEDRVEDPDETAAVREAEHGTWCGLKPGDWVLRHAGVDGFAATSDEAFRTVWDATPTPAVPSADRAALVEVAAQAIRDSNGTPEALEWWRAHPQLIPAHVYAAAVLAVLPAPADRAAVLDEAATAIETAQQRRDDRTNQRLGYLDDKTFHQHLAVHRSGRLLRHMAAQARDPLAGEPRPDALVHDPEAEQSAAKIKPTDPDLILAWRAGDTGRLYCCRCCPDHAGMFVPLSTEDLPDGGLCDDCGTDVLIPQEADRG